MRLAESFVLFRFSALNNFLAFYVTLLTNIVRLTPINFQMISGLNPNVDAPKKPELIIRESQPVELPPDVVRSSDKNDLGLSELQQLNVKERYNMFEHAKKDETHQMLEREDRVLKRGSTVLSKLAKYVFIRNCLCDVITFDRYLN